jgi:hypothetical protein
MKKLRRVGKLTVSLFAPALYPQTLVLRLEALQVQEQIDEMMTQIDA